MYGQTFKSVSVSLLFRSCKGDSEGVALIGVPGIPEIAEFFSSTEGMFGTSIWSRSGFGAKSVGHHGFIARTLFHGAYVPVALDSETGEMWRSPKTGFAKRNSYADGGEIIVKLADPSLWIGYFESEKDSKKKIVKDVFKKGDMYYRTGDALRRTNDGLWYFLDRLGERLTSLEGIRYHYIWPFSC